jgi:hypothetical protein
MAPHHAAGLLTRHNAIDVPAASVAEFCGNLREYLKNYQVFTMAKGNTKAQNIISTLSAESILILVEFIWIQMRSTDEVVSRLKAKGFGTLSLELGTSCRAYRAFPARLA